MRLVALYIVCFLKLQMAFLLAFFYFSTALRNFEIKNAANLQIFNARIYIMAHRFGYGYEVILEANCTQIVGACGAYVGYV